MLQIKLYKVKLWEINSPSYLSFTSFMPAWCQQGWKTNFPSTLNWIYRIKALSRLILTSRNFSGVLNEIISRALNRTFSEFVVIIKRKTKEITFNAEGLLGTNKILPRIIIWMCMWPPVIVLTREYAKRYERFIAMRKALWTVLSEWTAILLTHSIHHSDVNFRSLITSLTSA